MSGELLAEAAVLLVCGFLVGVTTAFWVARRMVQAEIKRRTKLMHGVDYYMRKLMEGTSRY